MNFAGEPVLPGHQKRLLLAAPQLRELRAQKRRHAAADVAAPELVPTAVSSNSPLQESVGQLSATTGATSQVHRFAHSCVLLATDAASS